MSDRAAALPTLLLALLFMEPGQDGAIIDAEVLVARIPPRPDDAPTGNEFIRSVTGLSAMDRGAEIYRQLASGNLPDFLRRLKPVTWRLVFPVATN